MGVVRGGGVSYEVGDLLDLNIYGKVHLAIVYPFFGHTFVVKKRKRA